MCKTKGKGVGSGRQISSLIKNQKISNAANPTFYMFDHQNMFDHRTSRNCLIFDAVVIFKHVVC